MERIAEIETILLERLDTLAEPRQILKSSELKELLEGIKNQPSEQRRDYGQAVNALRQKLLGIVEAKEEQKTSSKKTPIDVTAPFDANAKKPLLLPTQQGTIHPLMQEIETLSDIFERMGFVIEKSREIDDQFNMFEALNFPKGHPARDDYDTFMTVETDKNAEPLIAPAHTSTMQNRTLQKYRENLELGEPIAAVVPDRVFRNDIAVVDRF